MGTADTLLIARAQFGLNIAFHILFPTITIGLAWILVYLMDRITIWEAAAHPSSLKVVLIGALIVLPFNFAYTAFSYRVFRGKATGKLYD